VYLDLLKEMFEEMTVKKNASLIAHYYHPDFVLYTNGSQIGYADFLKSHEDYYQTPIRYEVEYDEPTWLEQGNKLAGRMWITTSRPKEKATKIEVLLIAEYQDNKIYRVWELTYPDWSQLPAFKD
jgi:hypothetical protein